MIKEEPNSKYHLICGDCLEELKRMGDESVNIVVTSPPYNLGGDFHANSTRYGSYKSFSDNLNEEDYQEWQIKVLNELYRVTKKEGFCFYVHKERIKNNQIITPIEWIKDTKWICSQTVILDMRSTANVDKRRFFPTHEIMYVLCKSKESKLNNKECLTSVWKVKKTPRKISGHPATFDGAIPRNCILASTKEDDIVLDCFMGVGTTGVVCKSLKRSFIGIELDREYFRLAQANIEQNERSE